MLTNENKIVVEITCPVYYDKGAKVLVETRIVVPLGEIVFFGCNEGLFVFSGDKIRTCQTDGQLSGYPLMCHHVG